MSDRVKQTKFKLAKLTLKLFLLKDAFNEACQTQVQQDRRIV